MVVDVTIIVKMKKCCFVCSRWDALVLVAGPGGREKDVLGWISPRGAAMRLQPRWELHRYEPLLQLWCWPQLMVQALSSIPSFRLPTLFVCFYTSSFPIRICVILFVICWISSHHMFTISITIDTESSHVNKAIVCLWTGRMTQEFCPTKSTYQWQRSW